MAPADPSPTRESLLIRIRDQQDQQAWSEFVEIYAPLVYNFARKQGLQDADATDVTQDVLSCVNGVISQFEYDSTKGKFRNYVFTITRNEIRRCWKDSASQAKTGNSALQELLKQSEGNSSEEDQWNDQHQRQVFQWACEKVKPEFKATTWQAFLLTSIEHKSAEKTARDVGISIGAVYIARSRVIKRIRELVQELDLD